LEEIFREVALVDLRVGVPLVDLGVLRAVDQDFLLAVVPVDQEAEALEDLAVVQEVLLVQVVLLALGVLVALEALGDLVVPVEVFLLQLLMTAVELML